MFEHQVRKEERLRLHYRKMFSKEISEYAVNRVDLLLKTFRTDTDIKELGPFREAGSHPSFDREKMKPATFWSKAKKILGEQPLDSEENFIIQFNSNASK
jgi:hypothetical protein